MKIQKLFLASFLVAAVLSSCNREDAQTPETRALASDESVVDFANRHLEGPVDALTMRQNGNGPCGFNSPYLPECVTVTDSGEDVYPRTLTLDFGDGCTGPGGVTRSGVIEVDLTGDMSEIGSVRTTTFDNFQVHNMTLTGTREITNVGPNDEENQAMFAQDHTMTITRNEHTVNRTYVGTLAWLEGFDTDDCEDNIVERNGVATHETTSDWGSSTRTLDAIVHSRPCGYPISGTVTVDRPQHDVVIDFGDGECDNLATLTRNGNTYTLNLDTHEIED